MKIQAFRRKSESTHEFGGSRFKFEKNSNGDFVAEVKDQAAIVRFLGIKDAFKPYTDADVKEAAKLIKPASRFVIGNGEETVDLSALGDAELKRFCIDNGFDEVNASLSGDELRQAIVDATKA